MELTPELKARFEAIMIGHGCHSLWSEKALEMILKLMDSAYSLDRADGWVMAETVSNELQRVINTIEAFKENDKYDRILAAYDEALEKAIEIIEQFKNDLPLPNKPNKQ